MLKRNADDGVLQNEHHDLLRVLWAKEITTNTIQTSGHMSIKALESLGLLHQNCVMRHGRYCALTHLILI